MSITKVAQAVGYDNLSSFIRAFKKIENGTPGLYRSGTSPREGKEAAEPEEDKTQLPSLSVVV